MEEWKKILKEGKELYWKDKYEEARKKFSQVIQLKKDHRGAYDWRGSAFFQLKKYKEAVKDWTTYLTLKKDDYDVLIYRAHAFNLLKKYEEAIRDCDNALKLNEEYSRAYYNRGNAYLGLQRYNDTIRDCSKSIELDKSRPYPYYYRGLAYKNLGKCSESIRDLSKAIELSGDSPFFKEVYLEDAKVALDESKLPKKRVSFVQQFFTCQDSVVIERSSNKDGYEVFFMGKKNLFGGKKRSKVFEGSFKNGKFHGEGVVFDQGTGKELYKGIWDEGDLRSWKSGRTEFKTLLPVFQRLQMKVEENSDLKKEVSKLNEEGSNERKKSKVGFQLKDEEITLLEEENAKLKETMDWNKADLLEELKRLRKDIKERDRKELGEVTKRKEEQKRMEDEMNKLKEEKRQQSDKVRKLEEEQRQKIGEVANLKEDYKKKIAKATADVGVLKDTLVIQEKNFDELGKTNIAKITKLEEELIQTKEQNKSSSEKTAREKTKLRDDIGAQRGVIESLKRVIGSLRERNIQSALKKITLKEVNIDFVQPIGSGACADVFGGHLKSKVALKRIKMELVRDKRVTLSDAQSECKKIGCLNHENVIKCFGVVFEPSKHFLGILTELGKESLESAVKKRSLNISKKISLMRELAGGMGFLHENRIVHKDLNLRNVLIGLDDKIKIIDFGISKEMIEMKSKILNTKIRGTPFFFAPETLVFGENVEISKLCDVFSFGVVCYCVYHEKTTVDDLETLFYGGNSTMTLAGQNQISKLLSDAKWKPKDPKDFDRSKISMKEKAFLDLVASCLQVLPQKRPTFKEIVVDLKKIEKLK